jgi:adenine-specific DNA-methyltransferase
VNYIGSKRKLLDFVYKTTLGHWDKEPGVFCDAFAGTGVVGEKFKSEGWEVQANDVQYYSVARLEHIFLNNKEPGFKKLLARLKIPIQDSPGQSICTWLNNLQGREGFVFKNFCLGGTLGQENERQYFSDENGQKCDAIRDQIEIWRAEKLLSEGEYYYLLAALLEAIDIRANTASVYGAFLKQLKKSAQTSLELKPLPITASNKKHHVYQLPANDLLENISGDILYLDPPYNQRQYGANYHVLETIALCDNPQVRGVTGLRDWSEQKSPWCSQKTVADTFEHLVGICDYSVIALSYNDEGLMSHKEIKDIMSSVGKYTMHRKKYSRFRSDKESARNHKRDYVFEYVHILEK